MTSKKDEARSRALQDLWEYFEKHVFQVLSRIDMPPSEASDLQVRDLIDHFDAAASKLCSLTPPSKQADQQETLAKISEMFEQLLSESFVVDTYSVFCRNTEGHPPEERLAAAERMKERFTPAVPWVRMTGEGLKERLHELAEQSGKSEKDELRDRTLSAIFLAVDEAMDRSVPVIQLEETWHKAIRTMT